jgi:hypothetical protein
VRLALGASRGRVIRQLLCESSILALAGAALGGVVAASLSRFLVTFVSEPQDPWVVDLSIDWRVLAFTGALAVLTCLLFGLTPALRATRTDPGAVMKATGRGLTASRRRFGLRRTLVVAQLALSMVLLASAVLFARSLYNLMNVPTGFDASGVVIANVNPPGRRCRWTCATRSSTMFSRGLAQALDRVCGDDEHRAVERRRAWQRGLDGRVVRAQFGGVFDRQRRLFQDAADSADRGTHLRPPRFSDGHTRGDRQRDLRATGRRHASADRPALPHRGDADRSETAYESSASSATRNAELADASGPIVFSRARRKRGPRCSFKWCCGRALSQSCWPRRSRACSRTCRRR